MSDRSPVRTCIGCRARVSSRELVRVVARLDGEHAAASVVIDTGRALTGRGAWLHPTLECYDQAVRRRAFGRALRLGVPVETCDVAAALTAQQA